MMRGWQPWNSATGPKTRKGKRKARMNAMKTGAHSSEIKAIKKFFAAVRKQLAETKRGMFWL